MRRPASHRPNLAHLVRSPLRGVAAFALASTALAQSAAPGVQHHRAPRIVAHTVVEGLEHPWAVAFLPDGRYLISERPGRLRVATPEGRLLAPITGLPAIASGGQGGLLDVALFGPAFVAHHVGAGGLAEDVAGLLQIVIHHALTSSRRSRKRLRNSS